MTPDERLAQLDDALKQIFGCYTRYLNQVFEAHGTTATTEQKIALAEKVLKVGPLGIAAHQYECLRREELGRPLEGRGSQSS
jgi:hypothetical protein